jgi:hypothetical protein
MQRECPRQGAYIATNDGYISISDIEDDEDQEQAVQEDGEVFGSEDTAAYMNIIMQQVLSVQVQQPEKL